MRPIRFRVWNKFNKKMLNAISIDLIDSVVAFPDKTIGGRPSTFAGNIKDYPIMQFTGLLDSKGLEIYEGDIVNVDDIHVVVGWNDKAASFCLNKKGWAFSHFFGEAFNPEDCEIIGNIYENPELIK